jgi:hypothetical protein
VTLTPTSGSPLELATLPVTIFAWKFLKGDANNGLSWIASNEILINMAIRMTFLIDSFRISILLKCNRVKRCFSFGRTLGVITLVCFDYKEKYWVKKICKDLFDYNRDRIFFPGSFLRIIIIFFNEKSFLNLPYSMVSISINK